jgi:hypothetical protein
MYTRLTLFHSLRPSDIGPSCTCSRVDADCHHMIHRLEGFMVELGGHFQISENSGELDSGPRTLYFPGLWLSSRDVSA